MSCPCDPLPRERVTGNRQEQDRSLMDSGKRAGNRSRRAYPDGEKTGQPLPGWRGDLLQGARKGRDDY